MHFGVHNKCSRGTLEGASFKRPKKKDSLSSRKELNMSRIHMLKTVQGYDTRLGWVLKLLHFIYQEKRFLCTFFLLPQQVFPPFLAYYYFQLLRLFAQKLIMTSVRQEEGRVLTHMDGGVTYACGRRFGVKGGGGKLTFLAP